MLKLRRGTLVIPVISALEAVHAVIHEVREGTLEANGAEHSAAESVLSFLILHLQERHCEIPEELDAHMDILGNYMEMPE